MSNTQKATQLRRAIEDGESRVYCGECRYLGERNAEGYTTIKEDVCEHPDFIEIKHTYKERITGVSTRRPSRENADNKCTRFEPIPEPNDNVLAPKRWWRVALAITAIILCLLRGILLV